MKKILSVLFFVLAMSLSANAQEKKSTVEEAGAKDASELATFLGLEKQVEQDFERLFVMKHKIFSDATISQEKKDKFSVQVEKKIEASLDGNQMEKLRGNTQLYKKLTHQ